MTISDAAGVPRLHRRAFLLGAASSAALSAPAFGGTITYTYDELGRVRTATYPNGAVETFNYDAAGNRTSYTVAGGPDVTPNALNWANISGVSGATNAAQTIAGITASINLTVTYTGAGTIQYAKNAGTYTTIATGGTVSVANNDTLSFKANGNASGTVTVANASDGGATLDTFTYAVTADVTPNALNWANISGLSGATNAAQAISGINTPISLMVTYTGTGGIEYSKNASSYTAISTGGTISVSNNDTVSFKATSSSGSPSGTVTVTNTSDGGATLDTFTYALSASDVTPNAVNWANISGSSGATNAAQTISGINTAITLAVTYTGPGGIEYSKNSGTYTAISSGGTVSMSDSDTLSFKATASSGSPSGTVTVANTSDGGLTLDTFTYAVTAVDVTPNAVDWANISGSSGATNAAQTISGINTAITLTVTYTGAGAIEYSKNAGAYVAISTGGTLSVSNSDTLSFKATASSGSPSGTVTVANSSDGGVTLDTFTYAVSAANDVTPDAINWTNISAFDGSFPYTPNGQTNTQFFTGINQAITVRLSYTGDGSLEYSKNNGTLTPFNNNATVSISNNDSLRFRASSTNDASGTVSVYNDSDSSALLDTFTYFLTTGQ